METQNKLEIVDFSQFKWRAFIPGETIVEDFGVMKFSGRIEDIVPEHYFPATYTLQVITAGTCKVNINNKVYELSANSGYFTSPDFLLKRPEPSATSATPIQQIADRLGFQNQSHFGTFFKRHEGCSPKDFRTHNHKLM